jgi:ketosteroid isomerase-like protein
MASPNKAVIHKLFEAYTRGENETLRLLLSPNVIYHLPGRSVIAGDYHGQDVVLELWARQKSWIDGKPYRSSFLGMLEEGDQVLVLTNVEASIRGKTLAWQGANLFTVRDGRVAECRIFIDDLYAFDEFWTLV